jgi:hypothetical protein
MFIDEMTRSQLTGDRVEKKSKFFFPDRLFPLWRLSFWRLSCRARAGGGAGD